MMNTNAFEIIKPQIVDIVYGPEPSLYDIISFYYNPQIDDKEKANNYIENYIEDWILKMKLDRMKDLVYDVDKISKTKNKEQ